MKMDGSDRIDRTGQSETQGQPEYKPYKPPQWKPGETAQYPDGTLLQGTDPKVYIMAQSERHWIPDPATFQAKGYDWSAIQRVSDAVLAAIPEGAPIPSVVEGGTPPQPQYPDGTFLKASGAEIDRMEGGKRRAIPDAETLNCIMGSNWGAVQTISDAAWNAIQVGTPYPSRADNKLIQGTDQKVYIMAQCQRHWIPDLATFQAHGCDFNAIQHVSDADLAAIVEGPSIPSVTGTVPSTTTTTTTTTTPTSTPVDETKQCPKCGQTLAQGYVVRSMGIGYLLYSSKCGFSKFVFGPLPQ